MEPVGLFKFLLSHAMNTKNLDILYTGFNQVSYSVLMYTISPNKWYQSLLPNKPRKYQETTEMLLILIKLCKRTSRSSSLDNCKGEGFSHRGEDPTTSGEDGGIGLESSNLGGGTDLSVYAQRRGTRKFDLKPNIDEAVGGYRMCKRFQAFKTSFKERFCPKI
uniref:Uncharacterized protein n=1 Tax=Salix viminalis TaxID=40686 RepID=A0A6N2MJS7_SALVM